MATSLTRIRKNPAFPFAALLTSLLLVAGQTFTCCKVNRQFSEKVGGILNRISQWAKPADATTGHGKSHPGCHGHPAKTGIGSAPPVHESAPIRWNPQEDCLAELSAKANALPSDSQISVGQCLPPMREIGFHREPIIPRSGKPIPSNKSSPPLYLLTLRILV